MGQIFFSNVRYRKFANEAPADMPAPVKFAPAGLVSKWRVSAAMTEAEGQALAVRGSVDVGAKTLEVELNGIANLGRLLTLDAKKNTGVASFTVASDAVQTKMLRVGYSDRVTVYVNGAPVFAGDSLQYGRDPRFLGIVGLFDTVAVPLRKGENTVAFVVSERNGGWAAEAEFVDLVGLRVEN